MGMKTAVPDKFRLGLPGPGEYESKFLDSGNTHLIGTGLRSDLGIGKAFLGPGVG